MAQAQPETWPRTEKWPDTFRLVHLSDGATETWSADQILPGGSMLYLLSRPSDGKGGRRVTASAPGVAAAIGDFALPAGDGVLLAAGNDSAFAYIAAKNPKMTVLCDAAMAASRAICPCRSASIPSCHSTRGASSLSRVANTFHARCEDQLVVHSTSSMMDRALGVFDRDVILDSKNRVLTSAASAAWYACRSAPPCHRRSTAVPAAPASCDSWAGSCICATMACVNRARAA